MMVKGWCETPNMINQNELQEISTLLLHILICGQQCINQREYARYVRTNKNTSVKGNLILPKFSKPRIYFRFSGKNIIFSAFRKAKCLSNA